MKKILIVLLLIAAGISAQTDSTIKSDSVSDYSHIKFLVVLDPAHGNNTPGKCSPDGKFFEYRWSREILEMLSTELDSIKIKYAYSNKYLYEIGLKTRRYNTNKLNTKYGKRTVFISLHANAAGMGYDWMTARGFSVWTSRGKTTSDTYAEWLLELFEEEFEQEIDSGKIKIHGNALYESNFAVLLCRGPAILIETMFQDNKKDVEIMTSENFKKRYVKVLLNFIIKIVKQYEDKGLSGSNSNSTDRNISIDICYKMAG